ncbi:hypothetical protein HC931_28400 [Candidatus Gracilibacteria bacterium]|nr:hypothetical protein [Candidatus Gracilibacteria bacterium]NJM90289.1 hypothetical protein [Hydrococcus sp. RU_2_2]NJP22511.1 hypothetical protein [Hydrococcus sp. CRU_1_1]
MFNRPRFSTGRSLFMFLVGLALGTLTVNGIIAPYLTELVGALPKGKIIASFSLLFALIDVWLPRRGLLEEEKKPCDRLEQWSSDCRPRSEKT